MDEQLVPIAESPTASTLRKRALKLEAMVKSGALRVEASAPIGMKDRCLSLSEDERLRCTLRNGHPEGEPHMWALLTDAERVESAKIEIDDGTNGPPSPPTMNGNGH